MRRNRQRKLEEAIHRRRTRDKPRTDTHPDEDIIDVGVGIAIASILSDDDGGCSTPTVDVPESGGGGASGSWD